ncbi:MAG: hypothetical protein P8I99_13675 [Acidimicrobiales bacterium]|nr:hypothetical protein [Acidimicrobiales bacterium]MDG1878450.1 hypothetical protein [Acidimicrobiales bacterium]
MPRQPFRCPPDPEIVAGFERIRERLEIPAEFPQDVLQEAKEAAAAGPQVPDSAAAKIRDARDIPFIAIDPAGSTDLHQAFAAQRSGDGYIVYYAIADVAAFITLAARSTRRPVFEASPSTHPTAARHFTRS